MSAAGSNCMAVLTGDIVGSRKADSPDPRKLAGSLQAAAREAKKAFPGAGLSAIDVFRGDSWQMLVEHPEDALRITLFLRTFLQGGSGSAGASWITRVGIGLGPAEWVDSRHVSRSQGKAFVASGQAIDSLSGSRRHLAMCSAASDELERSGRAVVTLLDALVRRWTKKQAWAVCGALCGLTQEAIAAAFVPPVGRRTAGDHLERADWDAVGAALKWWEERTG
jgi:hypothetical protein